MTPNRKVVDDADMFFGLKNITNGYSWKIYCKNNEEYYLKDIGSNNYNLILSDNYTGKEIEYFQSDNRSYEDGEEMLDLIATYFDDNSIDIQKISII